MYTLRIYALTDLPVEGTTLDRTKSDLFPTNITTLSIFSCFLKVNKIVMALSKESRSSQE